MAVIEYQVKENTTLGTHSFFAVAKSFSTLDFDDLAAEVVESVGIAPSVVRTVLERYMVVAKRNVLRGHRVKMGDLLTIYPQISCSVKDELDDEGNVIKVATADMLNIQSARGSIGATILQSVQQDFAKSVSWRRANSKSDEEETSPTDTTDDQTTDPDTPSGGDGGSGSGDGNE